MAGDWIKMRVDLADDPAVIGMASYLKMDEYEIIGRLHKLWSWADKHNVYTASDYEVDSLLNKDGISNALIDHGFLIARGASVEIAAHRNGEELYSVATRRIRPTTPEWVTIRRRIFQRDNYTCTYCGAHGVRLECDHVVPVSRGGSNEDNNLATACFDCNRSKKDRMVDEWRAA